jgi:hypothetical protein
MEMFALFDRARHSCVSRGHIVTDLFALFDCARNSCVSRGHIVTDFHVLFYHVAMVLLKTHSIFKFYLFCHVLNQQAKVFSG